MTWDATEFRQRVQDALDDFLDLQGQRMAPLGPDAERLLAEARAAVSGGKRFRAAFCWWGHLAVAPAADEQALARACASLELLHASALVHDDLMDASDTRRGRPATHRGFEAEHRAADGGRGWRGDPEQYGAAAAILLGDLLLAWADELLRTCGLPLEQVGPALEVLDRTRTEVVAGQFLDVSVQARGRADVDAAMTVLRYKSAKYSIERPLHTGAALAGADEATTAALRSFGLPLGEAFQLRDDLLGVFGDPDETGKNVGDDLAEGKITLPLLHAMKVGDETDRRLVADTLRNKDGSAFADIMAVVKRTGGIEATREAALEYQTQAMSALETLGQNEATVALSEMAGRAVDRRG